MEQTVRAKDRHKVRLGHAIRGEDDHDNSALELALGIVTGAVKLGLRPPRKLDAVLTAEGILGAARRPIYAFVGSLHPDLGTVGLIVSPAWAKRCVQGTSRCDSGGLVGGFGGFACILDKAASLKALSYEGADLVRWEEEFQEEIRQSYVEAEADYVRGSVPNYSHWGDVRVQCIEYVRKAKGKLDRRLWTWEARLRSSPLPIEVECIVLSPEMRKRLERLRHSGFKIPASVRILAGSVLSTGVHWFESTLVHEAFLGV